MTAIEVIPGVLLWAPERFILPDCTPPPQRVSFNEICGDDFEYLLPHDSYQNSAWALGTPGLEQVMKFCLKLEQRICAAREAIAVTVPLEHCEEKCRAAVLFGAFLILRRQWTAHQVEVALGAKESRRVFDCHWGRTDRAERGHMLSVGDCWSGLTFARMKGWIDCDALADEARCSLLCNLHRQLAVCYEATWIVPGRIMVSADPSSLKEIFRPPIDESVNSSYTFAVLSPNSCGSPKRSFDRVSNDEASDDGSESSRTLSVGKCFFFDRDDEVSSVRSVETVQDFYGNQASSPQRETVERVRPLPFSSFLAQSGV
eukprot:TRINITY_DN24145_c0_g1_i2.p1 TRINITY_DN24145_c0_g1~~TRINITY_DN24145_c0_g1_i2.p1  ORF type:complete len:316 (+),score=40.53 TRINITY_DN24145_c0_g1_i2:47-994(+)